MANEKRFLENRVTVLGTVKSIKVTDRDEVGQHKFPAKSLRMVVSTGEGENHTVEAFAMKHYIDKETNKTALDKTGQIAINGAYTALETVEREYISQEQIDEQGLEVAPTVVKVNGSLENNMYKNKAGQVVEGLKISGRFFNRIENNTEEFGVTYTIEGFTLTGAKRVTDKDGEDTEEVSFKAATIDYRGLAHPFVFTVTGAMADGVEDGLEQGMSVLISGKIRNKFHTYKVARETTGMTFGEEIVDVKHETIRKTFATGINAYDEDDKNAIAKDLMSEAIKKYEAAKLEVKSAESKKKEVKANNGFNAPTKKPVASTMTTDINEDDLPF